ncbi:PKD domain-containing protein, partial [Maribacter hydrothermalis]|uniref:PKD domain-containing protein n=1 Tax=Maribacter hydrothermalis TaxID=1836467 RepID=UPI000B2B11E0
ADPAHTFTTPGVYNVTLTVTDTNNVTDTESISITVNSLTNQPPVATIMATPVSGSIPLFVEFTGSNSTDDIGIVSFLWDFADGTTSTDADPNHTFITVGDYVVTLTVTDTNGITDTENITISVNGFTNEAPVAVIAANPTSGNAPLTVNFTGSNSTDDNGVVSYLWDFADGTTSELANPTHTFNDILEYNVTLTVTDANGLTNTQTALITVNDLPNEAPVAAISANPISGNSPLTVNFTGSNSTDDNGIVSYLWDFADGTTSDIANPTHTFNNILDYNVTLTVTDANGESNMTSITISVNDLPNEAPVAIISANPISGNSPLTVDFTGSNSTDDNGIVIYLWDFADGTTSDLANPTHTFNNILDYNVTLTVTDANGESNMTSITISVNDLPNEAPVAIISANPISGNSPLTVDFTGSNSTDDNGIVSYLWDFADGTTSDLSNPTHTFDNVLNHVVTLTVTDANGLADTESITILVNENEPLNIPSELKDIIIYPNPVRNETLKIDLSKFMNEGLNIGFYDIYGKLVFQKMIDSNHTELLEIDLSILSNGVYLMELASTSIDDSTIKKVVKIE